MRRKQPICGTGSTTASILEKELESKDHEFSELKGNCQQLQELLLELPVLKNELQKSKQETKAVNQLLLQCRKSNAEFKEYTATLNMQMKDTKLLSEQQKELHKRIGDIQRERDENVGKFQRLSELLKEREVEIQRNKEHCVALKGLVDRLEVGYDQISCFLYNSSTVCQVKKIAWSPQWILTMVINPHLIILLCRLLHLMQRRI